MVEIKDSNNIIKSMKASKYKDLLFGLCNLYEKQYGIKSRLKVQHNSYMKEDDYLVLELEAPVIDVVTKETSTDIWSYSIAIGKSKPTYGKLFHQMFYKGFYLQFWFGDAIYSSKMCSSFADLAISIDLEDNFLYERCCMLSARCKLLLVK